jgi:ribose transport system substrate-binding protein
VVANNESNVGEVNAVRAQAKKLGVEVTILYDNANVDKQVTDFNTALAKKVDAIVFYPLDPKALGPSIAQAQKKGVKLFATDAVWGNLPVPAGITSVMLFNRDRAAYMQAQEMAKLKPHAKIVVMNFGGAPVPALAYYTSRAKYWAAQAGLTVLGEQDNPTDDVAGAQQAMSALLGKFSNIDGIIAYNDPSALGAYAAARSAGRMIIAIGQNGGSDARSGVQHGQEAASVFINTPAEGVNFLNGIYDLMANPSVKLPPELAPLPALMTKDTLNSVPSYEKAVAEIQSSSSLAPPAS